MGSRAAADRSSGADVRKEILRAAERVLAGTDLQDARVEDILLEANVSRRTFYQYYPNKFAVAAGLMEEAVGGMLASAGRLRESSVGVSAKIAATVDLYLALWRHHGRVMQSIVRESQRAGSSLCEPRERAVQAMTEFVCQALAAEGIQVSTERACFAIVGGEAVLMRAAHRDELRNRRLRDELTGAIQALLLGQS